MRVVCELIDLWNVYGDCENYTVMKGHSGAIMELHYSMDGRYVHMPIAYLSLHH